jgi:hypothetical protein
MLLFIHVIFVCLYILDEEKKELSVYSKNYLPILFNLYSNEEKEGGPDKLPILETIRTYLTVTDIPVNISHYIIPQVIRWLVYIFCYISPYSSRGEYSSSESTFHCFSLLVVSKFVQNYVFFSVSLIFTCVLRQLFSSGSVKILFAVGE